MTEKKTDGELVPAAGGPGGSAGTDVVPAALTDYAVIGYGLDQVSQLVQENVGGGSVGEFDLDRIKVPAGGGLSFRIPTLEGVSEGRTVEGVIVAWKEGRAYWETAFEDSGGGTPPDCSSPDGIYGQGEPGGACAQCPLAQYGSADKGKGQACKQSRWLFMLRETDLIPIVVAAPPTSIKPVQSYFLRLANNGLPYYGVITKLALSQARSSTGIEYSKIEPSFVRRLSDDETAKIKELGTTFRPMVDAAAVEVDPETAAV